MYIHIYIYIYTYTYIYEYMYICIYIYIYPPAPMNRVTIFKGQPRQFALLELVKAWYEPGTKYFHLTILVRWKSTIQQCWGIKPVPHDLMRRIKFWSLKSLEKDCKYLYWKISKTLFRNLYTFRVTYIIDWFVFTRSSRETQGGAEYELLHHHHSRFSWNQKKA